MILYCSPIILTLTLLTWYAYVGRFVFIYLWIIWRSYTYVKLCSAKWLDNK
jgi:hypothetical protein